MKTARHFLMMLAILSVSTLAINVNAQSGSRGPVGGGGSSSGGSTGGGTSAGGSGFGNGGVGGSFSRSLTPREGALRGQGAFIRAVGEANYFNAQAAREYEIARGEYLTNQAKLAQIKREHYQQKALEKERIRETWAQRRARRAMESPMQQVNQQWHITWPTALQDSRYKQYRTEIEELVILHAKLKQNSGVAAGLRASIEQFAKKIKMDEKEMHIAINDSKIIRKFVTELYQTNGKSGLMKKMDDMEVAKR